MGSSKYWGGGGPVRYLGYLMSLQELAEVAPPAPKPAEASSADDTVYQPGERSTEPGAQGQGMKAEPAPAAHAGAQNTGPPAAADPAKLKHPGRPPMQKRCAET